MNKQNRLSRDEKKAYAFITPALIATLVLIVYPLCYIFKMSFSENSFGKSGFAGLTNYIRLIKNPQFKMAVQNTFRFTFFAVVASFFIGLFLAILINQEGIRGKGIWRGIIFIAWVIPGVVKATAWKWILQTSNGVLNSILLSLCIIKEPIPWLTKPQFAMWSITMVQVWACAPYVMLMMTAGLQQVSKEIYESADLDGAGPITKTFKITLPILKDICFICILMLTVWALNEFSLIWIMTSGGQNTTTLSLLIYNQFKVLNINAASASSIMQLILTMAFAGIYVRLMTRKS